MAILSSLLPPSSFSLSPLPSPPLHLLRCRLCGLFFRASRWGVRSKKCGKPKCKGMKKAMEFDIQLQTEECLRSAASVEIDELPWKGGTDGNPDYECLRSELRRMAPLNGRAILLFKARSGCPVAKLEAWGPKRGCRHKKYGISAGNSSYGDKVSDISSITEPTVRDGSCTQRQSTTDSSTTRFICTFDGKQTVHEILIHNNEDENCSFSDCSICSFTCLLSSRTGRGFIEVDLHDLSYEFVPFIVADIDICSEICSLESSIRATDLDFGQLSSRDEVIEFLQEFGWLLERNYLSTVHNSIYQRDEFSSVRFKWLLEFSIERDCCAVVRKVLDILFGSTVRCDAAQLVLAEVNLLHRAVRRNCKAMVEFLLNYSPEAKSDRVLFSYNTKGPGGITSLHIAASTLGTDDVLSPLPDDQDWGWVQTWENDLNEAGFTPADYASQRGHDHYMKFVQRKISGRVGPHFTLDVSGSLPTWL